MKHKGHLEWSFNLRKSNEKVKVVIASPHARHDNLEEVLREKSDLEVLRVRQSESLSLSFLSEFSPRYIFFPHWSWIIPEEIFKKFECVIFHMTDLPYGRGGSPLQNLILRGHKETKLSALRCDKALDSGPIYIKRPLSLSGTAEEILLRASKIIEEMINYIIMNQTEPVDQVGKSTQFRRRLPKDGDLAGLSSLEQIYDYIRMLDADGYPSAFIENDHFKFEFRRATLSEEDLVAEVKITRRAQ
jgi:methionyl-tRNA formyltransferase